MEVEAFMQSKAGGGSRAISPLSTNGVTSVANTGKGRTAISPGKIGACSPVKPDKIAVPGGDYIAEMFSPKGAKASHRGAPLQADAVTDLAKTAARELAQKLYDQERARSRRSDKTRNVPIVRLPSAVRSGAEDSDGSSDSAEEGTSLRGARAKSGRYEENDDSDCDDVFDDGAEEHSDVGETPFDPIQDTVFRFKSLAAFSARANSSPLKGAAVSGPALVRKAGGTFLVHNNRQANAAPLKLLIEGKGPVASPAPAVAADVTAAPLLPVRPSVIAASAPPVSPSALARKSTLRPFGLLPGDMSSGEQLQMPRRRTTHRHSVMVNPDHQILTRYHSAENKRIEYERKKAEEDRVAKEAAEKVALEREEQDRQRRTSLYGLYFVTRTFIKRPDAAAAKLAEEHEAAAAAAVAILNADASSGGGSRNMHIVQNLATRAAAAASARTARRVGRRGATQALNIANMSEDDAQLVYREDQRKYRQVMDEAATDVLEHARQKRLQQKVPKLRTTTTQPSGGVSAGSTVHATEQHPAVLIDKELYFAVDHLPHADDSPTRNRRREGALSPSKMYAEMNKTPPLELNERPEPRIRNDVEFNQRAYKLAERMDLSYLVTTFDPANHVRGKEIVLDEDASVMAGLSEKVTFDTHVNNPADETAARDTATGDGTGNVLNEAADQHELPQLTEHERKQKAVAYQAYMKQVYEEEMQTMLDKLIDHLPDKLAGKVRKALAAKQHQLKLKRRQAYINRRRKIEAIKTDDVEKLKDFYENQKFVPGYLMTDSSDSGGENEKANKAQMDTLLGEFANVSEEQMAAMLEDRAEAEAAEIAAQEAAEARRLEM
jgi:hypothetical protein